MNRAKISIAIVGEGETEWFYFDSLRRSKRYSFSIEPSLPQHADIDHMMKLVRKAVFNEYDYVFCLLDMDRINSISKERERYNECIKDFAETSVIFIESMPCIEFWFLLHFLEHYSTKPYLDCSSVIPELNKYFKGYEKTKNFFRRNSLYNILSINGDIDRAKKYARKLTERHELELDNKTFPYSEIYKILDILDSLSENNDG